MPGAMPKQSRKHVAPRATVEFPTLVTFARTSTWLNWTEHLISGRGFSHLSICLESSWAWVLSASFCVHIGACQCVDHLFPVMSCYRNVCGCFQGLLLSSKLPSAILMTWTSGAQLLNPWQTSALSKAPCKLQPKLQMGG